MWGVINGVMVVQPAAAGDGADSGAAVVAALAEEQRAVVLDLTALLNYDSLLAWFDTIEIYLSAWAGTPLLVCTDAPTLHLLRSHPLGARVTTWPSLEAARTAGAQQPAADKVEMGLDPLLTAPRQARILIRETLTRWTAPELLDPANLVATELVTNAVQHAGTPMTLSLSRARQGSPDHPAIRLAVRDANDIPPVLSIPHATAAGGRGIWVVSMIAQFWGTIPHDHGKTVWAVLDGRAD